MTRELLGFFAPPRQLVRSGLIAAGISGVLLLLHLESLSLPALSLWFAWWLGGSFAQIAIQPISYWDRSWPVPHQLLLRTRILAAWLASGAPALALVITASALHGLGVVSEAAWARIVLHALCVLGLVPLACAAGHRLSERPQGSPTHVAALILLPTLALDAFLIFSGLGEARSVTKLFGPALILVVLTGSVGLLLTRVWVESPELASTPARTRRPSSAQPGAGVAGKGPPRAASSSVFWFFLRQGRGYAVLAWIYLVFVMVTAYFGLSGQMWFSATWLWCVAYGGLLQPSPLPGHLPISRQRLLVYVLAPQALFLLSGLMVEQFWPSPINVNGFGVERYAADSEADASSEELYRIVAPGFLWRASWGEPPLITTPEGVSRRPVAFAILPGLPLNVYNPYDARLDDPAFVNYQASRIMTREWKLEVSAADVERACHATRHGRISRWCLLDQIGTKRAPPRAWLFVRLWLLCVISLFSIQLPSNPASRRKPLRWLSLLWSAPTLLVLPMAIDQVSKHDPTGLASYPFRVAVLLGELTRLVERAPIVFGGLGLVLLGYYALVERTFVGTEGFIGRRNSQRSAR